LLNGVQTLAIVCNQWGDTGKGKFSDFFAEWGDVVARGTGGNNAGHTIVLNDKETIFHLLPAGVAYDCDGKKSVLGNGMAIGIVPLCGELDELDEQGMSYDHLMISKDAHVVMPFHVVRDKKINVSQASGGIGSTGRGIGPAYTDKTARRGIMIGDLLDKDTLVAKIKKLKKFYPEQEINIDDIVSEMDPYIDRIRPFVRDTVSAMHEFMREGKRIVLEGAQGLLLSIEHGTYHYVTSSDCSINGTACGVGLSARAIDLVLGVVKFPFMTRVGAGPFPTELGGKRSEDYCGEDGGEKYKREVELRMHEIENENGKYNPKDPKIIDMINSSDPFIQGVGVRLAAGEYGATTKRPRRIGWTDAVAARYAVGINGPMKLILTKADAVSGTGGFNICYEYNHETGATRNFNRDSDFLRGVEPVNTHYAGYPDIQDERNFGRLPTSLLNAIFNFESFVGARVAVVSVGPERDQTIVR